MIAAVALLAAACSDEPKNTKYPSVPITLTVDYGVNKSIFDVATVTAVVVDENGRLTATPVTEASSAIASASTPVGFMDAGATLYTTVSRKLNTLIPGGDTYVGFMLAFTPKKGVLQGGATTELIGALHFNLTDKFGSQFLDNTTSYVDTSVDASFLTEACVSLSNNCTFTYLQQPDGTYAYAPIYNWSEVIDVVNAGSLTFDESEKLSDALRAYTADFGLRRWSKHIAYAIYTTRQSTIKAAIQKMVNELDVKLEKPLKFRYYYHSNYIPPKGEEGEFSSDIVINP